MPGVSIKPRRAEIVRAVHEMMIQSRPHGEIVQEIMKRFGLSRAQAYRYLSRAYAIWKGQQARFDRTASLARAIEERQHAKRLALEAVRIVATKDGVETIPEPDHKGYLAALDSEAKLRGLNALEKHEVYVAQFGLVMQKIVQMIADRVEDVALRGSLILGLRGIFEEAPKAKAIGATVSRETGERVIDATIVPRETTNGST